jgi:hypothetical protein
MLRLFIKWSKKSLRLKLTITLYSLIAIGSTLLAIIAKYYSPI